MGKKEKFINFIVDHLIKKTTFDEYNDIVAPFEMYSITITSSMNFSIYHRFVYEFKEHIINTYGTSEEETELVWTMFRSRKRVYDILTNRYKINTDG
jgi:hypothetical protein